jgi:hypothetical protein
MQEKHVRAIMVFVLKMLQQKQILLYMKEFNAAIGLMPLRSMMIPSVE